VSPPRCFLSIASKIAGLVLRRSPWREHAPSDTRTRFADVEQCPASARPHLTPLSDDEGSPSDAHHREAGEPADEMSEVGSGHCSTGESRNFCSSATSVRIITAISNALASSADRRMKHLAPDSEPRQHHAVFLMEALLGLAAIQGQTEERRGLLKNPRHCRKPMLCRQVAMCSLSQ
jgi:hypothetical protein